MLVLGNAAPVRAELVPTQAVAAGQVEAARAELLVLAAREDVRAELERYGVSADEASARIAALSDAEVLAVHKKVADLPAGGDFVGVVVAILLVTLLVLIITDLLAFTDIFTFINPLPRGSAKSFRSATADAPSAVTLGGSSTLSLGSSNLTPGRSAPISSNASVGSSNLTPGRSAPTSSDASAGSSNLTPGRSRAVGSSGVTSGSRAVGSSNLTPGRSRSVSSNDAASGSRLALGSSNLTPGRSSR